MSIPIEKFFLIFLFFPKIPNPNLISATFQQKK